MKIEQRKWTSLQKWMAGPAATPLPAAQLVLVFGAGSILKDRPAVLEEISRTHPQAHVLGCSTAGEIAGTSVSDESLVATALQFEHTEVRAAHVQLPGAADSRDAGERLGRLLPSAIDAGSNGSLPLMHVLVLSDGLNVNGSDLVAGLAQELPDGVTVTGGLAGDGPRFAETFVLVERRACRSAVVAVGLYSRKLKVGMGSLGGWDPFGPERSITRSRGNVLYELDGRSALKLYRAYLGEQAAELPASGLLFPLSVRSPSGGAAVVRTILSVDDATESMTFAGDVPEGSYARLMKANFDRLIDGAVGAAEAGHRAIGSTSPDVAILISCVGRKLVLRQRIEEEVEGVRDVLGPKAVLTGFYSYGEISPFTPGAKCELHNQTMTITTLSEG